MGQHERKVAPIHSPQKKQKQKEYLEIFDNIYFYKECKLTEIQNNNNVYPPHTLQAYIFQNMWQNVNQNPSAKHGKSMLIY